MTERRMAIIIEADGRVAVGAIDDATGAVKRLDDATEALNRNTKISAGEADKSAKRWEGFGRSVGMALASVATGIGLLLVQQAELADATGETAARLGTSTEFLSEMAYATKIATGENEFLENALKRFNVTVAKAEQGSKAQGAALRSLGIDVLDTRGKLKTLEQLLPSVADKFQDMPDGPREAAIAAALFGREGNKMIPILNRGAAGIDELRRAARDLGLTITEETAAAASDLDDNLTNLFSNVRGLVNVMLADALPALNAVGAELLNDAARARKSAPEWSALGVVVKLVGTIYYTVQAIVAGATVRIAAAVQTVSEVVRGAGTQLMTFFRGVSASAKAMATGDLVGAFTSFTGMVTDLKNTGGAALRQIAIDWKVSGEMADEAIFSAANKIDALWNPAMSKAEAGARAAAGANDDLGDGFLGAGRKAAEGANKIRAAMEKLRDFVDDQKAATLSNLEQEALKYRDTQRTIAQLERETQALAGTAERERLLAEARTAAASAHERALRIAQAADDQRARERDIVGRVLQDYVDEARLIGLTNAQREEEVAVLKAAQLAREQFENYQRDTPNITAEEEANLRAQVRMHAAQRDATESLRALKDAQADQIEQMQLALKAHNGLNATARAELAIRKALVGLTREAIDARRDEIEAIRAQARELDTLEAQTGIQEALLGIFDNAFGAIQQGRDPWDAFRTEGLRALTDIGKKFLDLKKATGSWEVAIKSTGEALAEVMPQVAQMAGTAVGGGGQGAAVGAMLGGAIGTYFGGAIGAVIGSMIGGWVGGTFDDDPQIRVGPRVSKPEQNRTSRFQTFQVRTESMTDPTSSAVADAIVEFDALIYDMLNTSQRESVRRALANWAGDSPVLTDLMKSRMRAVLGSLDPLIGQFVTESSTDLQRQMQNLAEVLQLQALEADGELLTGTLSRAIDLIKEFGRAGESAGQTYQRLAGVAMNYGTLMQDVQKRITLSGLNDYQRQQVEIELQYRQQIKQANDLAKAMGLSGARAEDLAKIEQLRAINMAEVQRQLEAEQQRYLNDLSLSDLSPLRDNQKLGEAMRQLREAVSANDFARAQELSQTALGLGRNLFASGADYNALYDEVTGLVRQVGANGAAGLSDVKLDEIADLLTDLPANIARALFDQLYAQSRTTTTTTPPASSGGTGSGSGSGTGGGSDNSLRGTLTRNGAIQKSDAAMLAKLDAIAASVASTARTNAQMAEAESRRELQGIGAGRE